MLFDLRLHKNTVFKFAAWTLRPSIFKTTAFFTVNSFRMSVRIFNQEDLADPKLFNYFYLSRYFFGTSLQVTSSKKYFVLGKHYYNLQLAFTLNKSRVDMPLSITVFQIQPLVNLPLTRDYVISHTDLQWTLRDPSIFSERKTNTGLFDLLDPLVFTLQYRQPSRGNSVSFTKKLLTSLKFIF